MSSNDPNLGNKNSVMASNDRLRELTNIPNKLAHVDGFGVVHLPTHAKRGLLRGSQPEGLYSPQRFLKALKPEINASETLKRLKASEAFILGYGASKAFISDLYCYFRF